MDIRSIIPANNVVALAKSVASNLMLLLNNNNLRLVRLSESNSILWDNFIGSFDGRGGDGIFSIIEDAQGYIYVAMSYLGVLKPYVNDINRVGAIVLKLNDWGQYISHQLVDDVNNFTTAKIGNYAWMISNSQGSIRIQNLTLGGMITNINVKGSVQYYNSFHILNKLFLVADVCGVISYKQKALVIKNPTAILLIIDTVNWELWDYFRVTYILDDPLYHYEDSRSVLYVSGIHVRDHYLLAGYTNSKSISIYHRDNLLRTFTLSLDSTLFLIRINLDIDVLEDILTPENIDNIDVSINTFHFATKIVQRFNILSAGLDNILQGITDNETLLEGLNLPHNLYNKINNTSITFMLRINSDLNILDYIFLGSGNNMISRDCGCSDMCTFWGLRIPCRPVRIFRPPQVMDTIGCSDCNNGNCRGQTNGVNGDNIYTCMDTQIHCYSANGVQPGDLYMTKYNASLTTSEKRSILNPTESLTGLSPTSGNQYMNSTIITNDDGTTLIGYRFIDHIISNNRAVKQVYKQKWSGFLLSIS